MNSIAYGQVSNQMFAYDTRTGNPVPLPNATQPNATQPNATQPNATQLPGDIQIFKPVICVLQVVKHKNNFKVKLMNQDHAEDYDFPKLNPETNIFYNITYDPRIIIPALLKHSDKPRIDPHSELRTEPENPALNQALLARCIVESRIITYNQRTGQEIFNQKCNMLPYRCSTVNHIVNIERRGDKFIVEIQIYDLTTYDNVKYYPATDIFGECLHDPRVIIPAIRTNPNFANYFNAIKPQNTQQNVKQEDLKLQPHIKYVDIQGVRVVYDSKTGEEVEYQPMQGVEKPALHVDECNGLLCDNYEFIVFFLSNNAENVCRVVYNYHTGIFTGLTADPRIIIPYIRQSAEFNEYLKILQSTQERKKLTDDMQIKDYFTPNSRSSMFDTQDTIPQTVINDVPDVILPKSPTVYDTEPNQNEISDSNMDYPPLAIYDTDPEAPHEEPHNDFDNHSAGDVDQWAKRLLHNEQQPYDIAPMFKHLYSSTQKTDEEIREKQEQKEIEEFEQMAADDQNKILLHKIEIIRSKLREKQFNLQFLHHKTQDYLSFDIQQDKNPESNIIVETFAPAVKFTPRENNIYACTEWLTNIPKAQQHAQQ